MVEIAVREHHYKSTPHGELKLMLHRGSAAGGPRPVLAFFHGGAWQGGDPRQFAPFCDRLARLGLIGVSAAYRLRGTHGTTPMEAIADAKSALRWLHHVCAELPPPLLLQGTADDVTPFATAKDFRDRMAAAGNRCELEAYEGAGHGFFNHEPARAATMQALEQFLRDRGWLGEQTAG